MDKINEFKALFRQLATLKEDISFSYPVTAEESNAIVTVMRLLGYTITRAEMEYPEQLAAQELLDIVQGNNGD